MPLIIGQVKPHVLFVDDDSDFLHLLDRAVRRADLFCRITMCSDGEEALARLTSSLGASEPVQLVVTDLNMPGINGVELVAQIKGVPQTAHIPVAMLTSSDLPEDMVAAREAGVCGFFTKPHHVTELAGIFQGILRAAATVSLRVLRVRKRGCAIERFGFCGSATIFRMFGSSPLLPQISNQLLAASRPYSPPAPH